MVADREMVQKKLGDLLKYVKELEKHRSCTLKELQTNLSKQWTIAHGLQLAIQIVLDVGAFR